MKRLILLVCLLFVLTGCNAKYSVNIKSDGKVEEKVVLTLPKSDIESSDPEAFIKDIIETYKENDMYVDYNITDKEKGSNIIVTATRRFNTLEEYVNRSEVLPIIFEKTAYVEDYGIKGLQTMGDYYRDVIFETSVAEEPPFEDIDVEIHSQFEISESNSDRIDRDTNTMYWKIRSEEETFSINFKYNNSKRYDIIIKDYLKENWYSIIIVIAMVLAVIIVVKYIKKQNNLNNKI